MTKNKIDLSEMIEKIKNGRTCDYFDDFYGYSSSTYICDAISEIADGYVDIYYSDRAKWFAENWDLVDDAIAELGKADTVMQDIASRQFLQHERNIYDELETDIRLYAYCYLIDTLDVKELNESTIDEMEIELESIDNNNRFSDIEGICESAKENDISGMARLLQAFNEYSSKEFDAEPFTEEEAIKDGELGVCYTTMEEIEDFGLEEEMCEIQVSYFPSDLSLKYFADGYLVNIQHFNDIDEIAEDIENADFQAYYSIAKRGIEYMLENGGLVVNEDGVLEMGNPNVQPPEIVM